MAVSSSAVWEVRTTGSDNNGGYYDSSISGAGTDYSQQDSPQLSLSDIVAVGTTTLTSVTGGFTSAMKGNGFQVNGAFYTLTTVTNSNTVTVDRTISAGTYSGKLGGALVSPGKAFLGVVGGNLIYVKSGTYTISATGSNVAGGVVSMPAGTGSGMTRILGYGTSRGDGGTKPILQIAGSGVTSVTIITLVNYCEVEYISLDGQSKTSIKGFNLNGLGARTYLCKASNCTNSGFYSSTSNMIFTDFCEATGCSTQPAFFLHVAGYTYGCTSHDNTISGFDVGSGINISGCIASNNTGATTDGFTTTTSGNYVALECTSYSNGRHGFNIDGGNSGSQPTDCINCISVSNSAWGYSTSGVNDLSRVINCAGFNNASGNYTSANLPQSEGFLTLTNNPFNNPSGNDFSLNNIPRGGGLCRTAGWPSSFSGLSTNNYNDVGAAQHKDPIVIRTRLGNRN